MIISLLYNGCDEYYTPIECITKEKLQSILGDKKDAS